jgi:hypothetical protein
LRNQGFFHLITPAVFEFSDSFCLN